MLFVIAGGLRCSGGARVVGRKGALVIALAVFAVRTGPLSRPYTVARNLGEKPPELVERAHVESVFPPPLDLPRYSAASSNQ
jgi:hypothetical protein